MAEDLRVSITITGDGSQVSAVVDGIEREFADAGRAGARAGDQIERGFGQRLLQNMRSVSLQTVAMRTQMFSLRSAIGLVVGNAGIGLLVKNALGAADAIAKASDRIGIGIERLQEFQFAAKLSGVEAGEFENALRFLGRNAADASQGTGEAIAAFERLGVSVETADGRLRPLEDVLLDIADRFTKVTDAGERTQLVMDLFGRSGATMIPLIQGGSAAIEELARQAREAGVVMDTELVRNAERVGDQMEALGTSIRTNFQIGLLQGAANAMGDIAGSFSDPAFQSGIREWGERTGSILRYAVENADTILTIFGTVYGAALGARIGGGVGAGVGGALGLLSALELTGKTNILEFLGLDEASIDEQLGRLESQVDNARARLTAIREEARQQLAILGELTPSAQEQVDAAAADLLRLEQEHAALLSTKLNLQTDAASTSPSFGGGGFAPPPGAGDDVDDLGEDPRIAATASIEAYIQALRDEATALSLNAEQRAIQQNIMAAQAIAMDAGILLTEEQAAAIARVTSANIDAAEAETDWSAAKEEGAALTLAMRTPAEVYTDTLRDLSDLLREGHIGQTTFNRALEQAKETLEDADEAGKAMQESMVDLGHAVSTQFEDAILNGAKLSDVFRALENDIIRIIARMTVTKPLEGFLGGLADWIGDGFGGSGGGSVGNAAGIPRPGGGGGIFDFIGGIFTSIFHEGGVAGGRAPGRLVPADAFAGAQRLHSGGYAGRGPFAADEVPAILKRGEPVFPTSGVMRGTLGGGTTVNIVDKRGSDAPPLERRQRRGPDGREITEILIPAIVDAFESGRLDRTMRQSYGIGRTPG